MSDPVIGVATATSSVSVLKAILFAKLQEKYGSPSFESCPHSGSFERRRRRNCGCVTIFQ
jgi:hypothetical protein